MTFKQFWETLVKRQPALENDGATIEITPLQFRLLLGDSYTKGFKAGQTQKPAAPDECPNPFSSTQDFMDLLNKGGPKRG